MARRMDIELTSSRPDGSFTWRAAGAREPRGVLDALMAPSGAAVGQVLRVEADFDIDGITVVSVLPPRDKQEDDGRRIEIVGRAPREAGTVTTSLVERRGRGDRRGRERPERFERHGARAATRERRNGEGRPDERRPAERRHGARPGGEEPRRREGDGRPSREQAGRARPARLVPATVHRDALIAELPVEQRPIAEQLAAGGLPGVRRALADERAAARAAGRPEVSGEELIAIAEQLAGRVKEAVWLDRAEAVAARLDTVSLRDLRATVTAAAPRDEASRELLRQLRTSLDERVTKLRTTWEHDLSHALEEGRVLQALRLSSRPPEPAARLAASLVTPLAEAASAALNPSASVDRWIALLEAALLSPVRRLVKPVGLPVEDPQNAAHQAAAAAAGRIPALATLLGLAMPPPPRPVARPAPHRASGRPPRPASRPADEQAGAAPAGPRPDEPGSPAPATPATATSSADSGTASPAPEVPAPEVPAPESQLLEGPAADEPSPGGEAAAPDGEGPEAPSAVTSAAEDQAPSELAPGADEQPSPLAPNTDEH
ncbi:MAG: hypothetical protein M0004_03640 [Actinomycetota bacterium]|nr:hypothetical protein [Actinomycetota bacterium]